MPARLFKSILRYDILYFASLALVTASLPLSKYTCSMFQISALFFWMLYGVDNQYVFKKYVSSGRLNTPFIAASRFFSQIGRGLSVKMKVFLHDRAALVISSIFLLHLIGLGWSSDFHYAFKDLRTKLPILLLPIMVASGPKIDLKVFRIILVMFVGAVVAGCAYQLFLFLNLPVADPRLIEAHTSHIRFSLNAVLAIGILLYFGFLALNISRSYRIISLLTALAIAAFLVYMNYTTGVMLLAVPVLAVLIFVVIRIPNKKSRLIIAFIAFLIVTVPATILLKISLDYRHVEQIDFSKLDKHTREGNSYYHDTVNFKTKNGHWIGLYICDKELRTEWAKHSTMSLDSLDSRRQLLRFTLIRYMASKDLRKDAEGVNCLTGNEIRNIEKGVSTAPQGKLRAMRGQYEDFLTSLRRYFGDHDPNAGSMVQRFEYWRTARLIIRQHPLIGVGTGDVPQAFQHQYEQMHSALSEQFRLRSHNQYLSVAVAFGFVGLAWFLLALLYPALHNRGFNNYFYLVFWIILMLSMLTEDTLESQEGVTYFIVFTSIYLLSRNRCETDEQLCGPQNSNTV